MAYYDLGVGRWDIADLVAIGGQQQSVCLVYPVTNPMMRGGPRWLLTLSEMLQSAGGKEADSPSAKMAAAAHPLSVKAGREGASLCREGSDVLRSRRPRPLVVLVHARALG